MTETGSGADLLNNLAHEFAERYRKGERPALADYTDKYPDLADDIRELFPALLVMEQFGQPSVLDLQKLAAGAPVPAQLGEYRILREVARGGMGIVYEAVQEPLGRHVALKVLPFHSLATGNHLERFQREARAAANLHHTNIVPVFGVGEHQGLHYYAMQFIHGQSLDNVLHELRRLRRDQRHNSDKSKKTELAGQDVSEADLSFSLAAGLLSGRFEARIDNERKKDEERTQNDESRKGPVAPSTGIGSANLTESKDSPFTLHHSSLLLQPEQQYFRSVARLAVQVADALIYAHGQGVLHRDIKPSNLLLDTQGTIWVTDFGLAKATDSEDLTASGDLVGTLRYMAPERFQGSGDNRSDIYGLGATLYEMLTLRPAFPNTLRAPLIERILHEEVPPPRKLDPQIPRDMETIVLKSLAKEPSHRYGSAEEVADDLRRFLADRPVRARRISPWEQTVRWCRRNPTVASLGVAVATLLIAVAAIAFFDDTRLRQEHSATLDQLHKTEEADFKTVEAKEEATRRLYTSLVAQARASRFSRHLGQRFHSLSALADATKIAQELSLGEENFLEIRNQAIAAMALPDVREIAHSGHPGPADSQEGCCAVVSRDFDRYVSIDREGKLSVRRMSDNEEVCQIRGVDFKWCQGEFSRDGQFLKLYAHDHCQVWRLGSGRPTLVVEPIDEPAWDQATAIRPDSRELAVAFKDGSIGIYDLPSGQKLRQLAGNLVPRALAYHPSRPLLALAGNEMVQIRNTATGALIGPSFQHGWNDFPCVQWRPDGNALAASGGANDRVIHIWDAATGNEIGKLEGHKSEGIHFTFNHRGDLLVSNSWEKTLRLWDPRTFKQLFSVPIGAYGLFFNSDDSRIAAINSSGRPVVIYELAYAREYRTLVRDPTLGQSPRSCQMALPGSDRGILVAGTNDGIEFFDPVTGRDLGFVRRSQRVGVLGMPQELVTGDGGGLFRWPIQLDATGHVHLGPAQRFASPTRHWLACSSDGSVIASAQRWGAWVFSKDRAEERLCLASNQDVRHVAVSPDGRWVITDFYGTSPVVKIWNARNGDLVKELPVGYRIQNSRFSPDGRWLATSGVHLTLWEVDSWQPRCTFDATGDAAISGRLLAFETGQGVIRVVDLQTSLEMARFEDPDQDRAQFLTFSSDGTMLIAASNDSFSMHVWDLRAIAAKLAEMGLDWKLPAYSNPKSEARNPTADVSNKAANRNSNFRNSDLSLEIDPGDLTAREKYSLILAFFPWCAEAYYQRGLVHARYEQWEEAGRDFAVVLGLQPDFGPAYCQRGLAQTRQGRHLEAVADFTRAVNLQASQGEAYLARGKAYLETQEWQKGESDFSKFLELKPGQQEGHRLRATAETHLEKWEEALVDLSQAIEIDSGCTQAWKDRAAIYLRLGQWQQAALDFAELQKLEPQEHWHWYQGATLSLHIGQTNEYRRMCREMLMRFGNTDSPEVAERVAKTCCLAPDAISDLAPVLKLADRAVTGTENHPYYRWFLLGNGLTEYRAGHYLDAVEWIARFEPQEEGTHYDASAFAVLAMAKFHLNRSQEGYRALAGAQNILSRNMPKPIRSRPVNPNAFHDWLHALILTREAQSFLGEKKENR
jgi:serine/threonine protein kinase/WD40 repeat protein/regulator of sirC expression with transglutaminase-like and TPR domain